MGFGCGMCLAWLLKYASDHPNIGTQELLQKLDDVLDTTNIGGMKALQTFHFEDQGDQYLNCSTWSSMVKQVGFAYRPRRYEVAMALSRMRGMKFQNIPSPIDEYAMKAAAAKLEAERKKQELLAVW